jgi:hypothetical protein
MAQDTQIKGFAHAEVNVANDKLSFGFGEWDLFITSQLNDNFSFLGETVFKYAPGSNTEFSVGVERLIINYNYAGNHSALLGKHHTPVNFWNDTYHHGRVFFPTIGRPVLFSDKVIPIHTTGIAFQGLNLGNSRFGYNVMIGNGLGSSSIADNDKFKSITMAAHIKPQDNVKLGVSYYNDVVSAGAEFGGNTISEQVNQQLFTGSVSYFGKKIEVLTEGTLVSDKAASTGTLYSFAYYLYAGVRIYDKLVPYIRYDLLNYDPAEILFAKENANGIVAGVRYEITYLIVVKTEYQHLNRTGGSVSNQLSFQVAVGF